MTAEELYDAIGAKYEDALATLHSERLINKYVVRFPDEPTYGQLLEAKQSGNEEQIFRCAHTFKGICLNLALTNIFFYADIITEHYRPESEKLSPDIENEFKRLDAEYNKTVELIKEYAAGL